MRDPMGRRLRFLPLVLLVVGAAAASADVLVPKRGKRAEGTLVKQDASEVVLNIYFSPNPGVTNAEHLLRVPAADVKEATVAGPPEVDFHKRLDAADRANADALAEIARFAEEHKLKAEAEMAWALVLAVDATRKDALKGVGSAATWKKLSTEQLQLNGAARDALKAYVEATDVAKLDELAKTLASTGWLRKPEELERRRRSQGETRGLVEDLPVSWNASEHDDAVATWYVPRTYTPTRSWPLIVGLHGGGPGGLAGDEVVGSGPSAMNFYRDLAEQRGFLVVCPTALVASWGQPRNEQLVRDVIQEALHRFAIDPDRVYLTGHSMGGFGTWALAPRLADELAAVSPMAGAGGGAVPTLVKTRTPIFIYHSADDFIDVNSDRAAAKQLKDSDLDFVYTELPDQGHGFPESIRKDLFDFFAPRRLYEKKRKSAWPRCSLDGKPSKDEAHWLGDPLEVVSGTQPALGDVVDRLALGGGCARRAADVLIATKPDGASAALAKLLKAGKAPPSARAEAARVLGALGDRDVATPALERALALEASRAESVVVVAAAKAAAALDAKDVLDKVESALQRWSDFHRGKVSGGTMDFADWERSLGVLVPLVTTWGALAESGRSPSPLCKHVVDGVLAMGHDVRTSDRVPQDPSVLRVALAKALAAAYAKVGAGDDVKARLVEVLAADPKAQAAAQS